MKDEVLAKLAELMYKIASGEYIVTGTDMNNGYEQTNVLGNPHPILMPTGSSSFAVRYHHRPITEDDVKLDAITQAANNGENWIDLVKDFFEAEE